MPLMSLKYPRYKMSASEIRSQLGFRHKLPPFAIPEQNINGYRVRVDAPPPRPADPRIRAGRATRHGMKHRVMAYCGTCGEWIPFGRLAQHEPACVRRDLLSDAEAAAAEHRSHYPTR